MEMGTIVLNRENKNYRGIITYTYSREEVKAMKEQNSYPTMSIVKMFAGDMTNDGPIHGVFWFENECTNPWFASELVDEDDDIILTEEMMVA